MAKRSFKAFLACVLATVALTCVQAQTTNSIGDRDVIDCDAIAVDIEMYIWNRISDALDIFQFGLGAGPGIGFEFALTNYIQLGLYANCEKGIVMPHIFPPFWLVDYYENNEWLTIHSGSYATASFGPWRAESYTVTTKTADPRYFNRYDEMFRPDYKWDIRLQADLLLLHPYFNFRTMELVDFVTGFVNYDMSDDDCHLDPTSVRLPANQFGRSICNILFGIVEIPMNIFHTNAVEGDLPAISKGFGLGVWRFLVREVVGFTELITFPFGWQPIIEPAYPFQLDSYDYNWRVYRPSFHKRY